MSEKVQVAAKKPEAIRENKISKIQKADLSQSISSPVDRILFLQRTIGNRAVQRLINSESLIVNEASGLIQRKPLSSSELENVINKKKAELEKLRKKANELQDQFLDATLSARSKEFEKEIVERERKKEVSESQTTIHKRNVEMLNKTVRVIHGDKVIRLIANIQITFRGLSEKDGRKNAEKEIPRLIKTIRDAWTVELTQGEFSGYTFSIEPHIKYRLPSESADSNAWQLEIRAKADDKPSAALQFGWEGIIELNPNHLKGDRIVTVAHELYHLFGLYDEYLEIGKSKTNPKKLIRVGRTDPSGRADLLGLVDPVALKKRFEKGEITKEQFDLQTKGKLRVWEEDIVSILSALAVPTPTQKEFEDTKKKLEKSSKDVTRTKVLMNSMEWLKTVEAIIKIETELKDSKSRSDSRTKA